MSSPGTLSPAETAEALRGSGFRHEGDRLRAQFRTRDFRAGARLVAAIADAADRMDHHPDLTLTYRAVGVELTSHDAGGVTGRDLELARQISSAALAVGADPASA